MLGTVGLAGVLWSLFRSVTWGYGSLFISFARLFCYMVVSSMIDLVVDLSHFANHSRDLMAEA